MNLTTHRRFRNSRATEPEAGTVSPGSATDRPVGSTKASIAATTRKLRSAKPSILACIAGFTGLTIAETCLAVAANFTVLNQATVTLTSLDGSPVSSSAAFTGPASDTDTYPFNQQPIGNLSAPNTGSASIIIYSPFAGTDSFGAYFSSPNGGGGNTYDLVISLDVTFNSSTGSVERTTNLFPTDTFTITPLGGTATPFSDADPLVLVNGRYTITWSLSQTTPASGAGGVLWFEEVAAAPSAVPGGTGLAALAFGAAGLRGRRRSRN